MKRVAFRGVLALLAGGLSVLSSAGPALACAVCFGDPDAAITQGAKAGILVLGGVIATVLTGIGGVALFWIWRARALDAQELTQAPLVD